MLYLYYMDRGWRGSIVVIAKSESDARLLMESCENYDDKQEVIRYPLIEGLTIYNLGDS